MEYVNNSQSSKLLAIVPWVLRGKLCSERSYSIFDYLEPKLGEKDLSPGAVGNRGISKGIVIRPFNYAEQNDYLRIFIGRF